LMMEAARMTETSVYFYFFMLAIVGNWNLKNSTHISISVFTGETKKLSELELTHESIQNDSLWRKIITVLHNLQKLYIITHFLRESADKIVHTK
jgi:hypothetical protein